MTEWHVPQDRGLSWYERDGEAVVFNASSGRSHFLNAMTNEVLHYLEEEGPRNSDEIEAHIRSIVGEAEMPNLDQQVRGIINGFLKQGLVDPWQG
jgi:PqqD family protein of HPr-rel-A system